MKNIILGLFMIIGLQSYAQRVENVKAELSGTNVVISYDLFGNDALYNVKVYSSSDNYKVPLTFVTGDVGNNIGVGNSKKISWDYNKENLKNTQNLNFKIDAVAQQVSGNNNTNNLNQEFERKGYIGISLGPSFPMGDFKNGALTGLQISLINFGYLFTKNIGVTANWFGSAYDISTEGVLDNATWSIGGLTFGPLISFSVNDVFEFDIRPTVGFIYVVTPEFSANGIIYLGSDNATAFNLDLGATVRFNFAKRWALLANIDYMSSKPKFATIDLYQQINTLGITAGIAYRLK
jgi:hypothetical protein